MRFNTPQHLPCSQKEQKPNNMISLSCAKDLDITSLHFESTPCVFGKLVSDVKDEKCCSVGFLHTLLALAFPATFLTLPPSHHPLCCNIPYIFPSFHFFPYPPSLFAFSPLSDHWKPSSLLHNPAQSQALPPFLSLSFSLLTAPPLFSSTHYFLRFSNMSFHRMLPPVSLGREGGLAVFLFRKRVKISGTSHYNDTANNGSSCYVSVLPLFFFKEWPWLPQHHQPASELWLQVAAVKNTESLSMNVNRAASVPQKEPWDQQSWLVQ